MKDLINVYYSNRVEQLVQSLKQNLYVSSHPFSRRLVVIPSPAMKSSVMMELASDPDYDIAAGLEMCYLDQALTRLLPFATFPSSMELALGIEAELRRVACHYEDFEEKERLCWKPLIEMLPPSCGRTDKRLLSLSVELSYLFQKYGKYAGNMLKEWATDKSQNTWQQVLWKTVYQKYGWNYFCDPSFIKRGANVDHVELHLFCLNHFSRFYHHLFTQLASLMPVSYYVLSPCQAFWSDLPSPKKMRASEIEDGNPLLMNNGKLGREMARVIEEGDVITQEEYVMNKASLDHAAYCDYLTGEAYIDESKTAFSLLNAIQMDMLVLRHPENEKPIPLRPNDSVHVHSATTPLREVQILHDNLLRLIERHSKDSHPITPQDILVMAPKIRDYAPHLKVVFAHSDLDFQLMDRNLLSHSILSQDFIKLLRLSFSRWDSASLLQLLESNYVKKRHQLSDDDLCTLRLWIKETNVWWGVNVEHREEILKRDHCPVGMIDKNPVGTWEWAFDRLLYGLAVNHSETDAPLSPIDCVDNTQMDLLGKWIFLVRSLHKDLQPLVDGTTMTFPKWMDYLKGLLDSYFDTHDVSEPDAVLIEWLTMHRSFSTCLAEEMFSFASIFHHLEAELEAKTLTYREKNCDAVRFCSLLPMRAVPAKIIVLMGMQEGVFPTKEHTHNLDCTPHTEFIPFQRDYDRFLFLECLLSARDYFLLSYQRLCDNDGQAHSPSLLISELMHYCDQAYSFEGKKISESCMIEHPHDSFNASYFDENATFSSYSHFDYRLAKAYYQEKTRPHCFIPSFSPADVQRELHYTIELSQLAAFARNPLRSYMHHTLGMYLKEKGQDVSKEEPFTLSQLEHFCLKKAALTQPLERVMEQAQKEGRLPLGVFQHLSLERLREETEHFHMMKQKLGLTERDFYDIELSEQCEQKVQIEENLWRVPALKITSLDQTQYTLVGRLSEITPEGHITLLRDDRQEILKIWPLFLVMHAIIQAHDFPYARQILFMKNGKVKQPFYTCPLEQLTTYLEYYIQGLQVASPLLPEWTYDFLVSQHEELEENLRNKLHNPFRPLYHPYFQWTTQGHNQEIHENWKRLAEDLFGDLFHHWYPCRTMEKKT